MQKIISKLWKANKKKNKPKKWGRSLKKRKKQKEFISDQIGEELLKILK